MGKGIFRQGMEKLGMGSEVKLMEVSFGEVCFNCYGFWMSNRRKKKGKELGEKGERKKIERER